MNAQEPLSIEALIAIVALTGAVAFIAYRIGRWIMRGEPKPEPWGPDVDQAIHSPEAVPVCHRCFVPQAHDAWFCPECGTAVGAYNNWLPYIYIFSQGEVLRNGVTDRVRVNFLTVTGYLLLSVSVYVVFAPVYWYFLFRNLRRCAVLEEDLADEQNTKGD